MRSLFTLLVLLFSINVHAQYFSDIETCVAKGKLSLLEQCSEKRKEKCKCRDIGEACVNWNAYAELIPGHFQATISLMDCKDSAGMILMEHQILKILYKDSAVYYYSIGSPHTSFSTSARTLNYKLFDELRDGCYELYGTGIDADELFKNDFFSTDICGEDGDETKEFGSVKKMIEAKDTTSIFNLVSSANTAKQLYGLYGCIQLEKRGVKLDMRLQNILTFIRRKKGIVSTCSGCLVNSKSITDAIKEFIDKE